ncbi:MAG: phosphodiester glycosidase family protein [Bacilli bacterium]
MIKKIGIGVLAFVITTGTGIGTFFKTDLFETYRDLWVQTAMTTSNHKYLATLFLSDEEIEEIMSKYVVENDSNSTSGLVNLSNESDNVEITEIEGDTYTGYVIEVSNPSRVSLVDIRDDENGTLMSEYVEEEGDILAAINAGGFSFSKRGSYDGSLNSMTIIDQELVYGDEETSESLIGLSSEGELILGDFTYSEAIEAGIEDAISFGPFLIVDGEDQIEEEATGGLQPRTTIGQRADGTIILVTIEGRSKTSLGATLYDMQEIMKEYGAINAANLDGGGSSEMIYEGSIINDLSNGDERTMPTAFIVSE